MATRSYKSSTHAESSFLNCSGVMMASSFRLVLGKRIAAVGSLGISSRVTAHLNITLKVRMAFPWVVMDLPLSLRCSIRELTFDGVISDSLISPR